MGTVWINLGDSYSTQSGTNLALARNADYKSDSTYLINRGESANLIKPKNLPNKSLLLLPHRFAIGCMDRGWIVRNDIIWAKRNGMPESVRDRFSKKHEYMFFMVKQEKYYFDLDAVKEPSSTYQNDKRCSAIERARMLGYDSKIQYGGKSTKTSMFLASQPMKNPGSVSDFWDIPTKPSSDKHFAMYNDVLITKPILAGCPEGGIIYDPFAGTGTTIACAVRAKRCGIGSEMSKEFCDIFERNISEIRDQVSFI